MLIGLAKISGGQVLYLGEDRTTSIKKAQGLIGVVPDESNLYEDLSGFDNLAFCGALYGLVRQIRSLIQGLNEKGTTIFLTTHYIEEAERLCHRVAFICAGKIVRLDTVENLVADARDQFLVEVSLESSDLPPARWLERLNRAFPEARCDLETGGLLRVTSRNKLDTRRLSDSWPRICGPIT